MEKGLRLQLLRAAVKDRLFLKSSGKDLREDYFLEPEEKLVAKTALEFYQSYEEPIGGALRWTVDEILSRSKSKELKTKTKELMDVILGAKMDLVPVKALEDKVKKLRQSAFYETALEDIISAQEQEKFTVGLLEEIIERSKAQLEATNLQSSDYFEELDKRIEKRSKFSEEHKYPLLVIDELDEKIPGIGRGHFGMLLASYNSGKGMALVHLAVAYTLQRLNVLHITLEDSIEEVGNRFDACLSGLPISKLDKLPNKLKKRWARARERMGGRLKIYDGTEGGMTVEKIERIYEQERRNGFIADVIIVDYDDEIVTEKTFKGDSARRMELADIYRRMRQMASRLQVILWTASQGTRQSEGKKIITGKDAAEDISKIRKTALAIGIGGDPEETDTKYLFVIRHKFGKARFTVKIKTDFSRGIFYDREATREMRQIEGKYKA